ncbi:hypothetical protein Ciccas_001919 [Cichlidogyrus casuarinus]|uniref:Ion transport domain-containing protein n=1 Tax=Cichlidogyrus casuarinus TaxID=1844966 RepID=A0ABD2QIR7_9PLAT
MKTLNFKLKQNICSGFAILNSEEFLELFKIVGAKEPNELDYPVKFISNKKRKWLQDVVLSEICAFFSLLVTLTSVILVSFKISRRYVSASEEASTLGKWDLAFVLFFMVEKIAHLWAHGCKSFIRYPIHIFDSFMAICLFVLKMIQIPYLFYDIE